MADRHKVLYVTDEQGLAVLERYRLIRDRDRVLLLRLADLLLGLQGPGGVRVLLHR